ncbi:XTP/dITP diphosphatase [Halobacillus fulvus]|nr:XTP/dITP diphosphatase [Halobacillus fulvus]
MKELIVATKNEGKVREFRQMFEKYGIAVKSLLDIEDIEDIEETGTTFSENATIKAETISEKFQIAVIADDSGLEVDALNGEPGVYSARYAGLEKNDTKNLEKVLEKLEGVPDHERTARFVCAIAVARPGETTFVKKGYCEGHIARKPQGENGFGYDPIFVPKGETRTLAEHGAAEKNAISHRHHAIVQLEDWLKEQA